MPPFGVIFDIDGTSVDNHAFHEEAWLVWGQRNHKPIERDYYREHLYARTNAQIFRTLYGDSIAEAEIERGAMDKEAIYREIYGPVMEPMPGLVELLDALQRAGVPCAAASNANRINVDFVVDGLNLRRYFKTVLACEDVAHGKPDPEILLLAASRMGLAPTQCKIFEDSAAGFEAARRAGMTCIAITGHSRAAELPPHVTRQYPDFRDLTAEAVAQM
ncbi:MAG: HAD family phosphatase [Kiritimatiellae bacterium]|nr:HAD family phosphatase [Kiritimatiellia bacterium]MCO6400635.1 HAD family phosphatase [Verrucomicrobiota bacterium]